MKTITKKDVLRVYPCNKSIADSLFKNKLSAFDIALCDIPAEDKIGLLVRCFLDEQQLLIFVKSIGYRIDYKNIREEVLHALQQDAVRYCMNNLIIIWTKVSISRDELEPEITMLKSKVRNIVHEEHLSMLLDLSIQEG